MEILHTSVKKFNQLVDGKQDLYKFYNEKTQKERKTGHVVYVVLKNGKITKAYLGKNYREAKELYFKHNAKSLVG